MNFGNSEICTDITVHDECSTKNRCTLEYTHNGQSIEKNNFCALASNGKSVCGFYYGNPEMDEYIKQYKAILEKLDEEDLEKMENYGTLDSKDIFEAYIKFINYPELKDAEQCVIDHYVSRAYDSSQGMISLKKILLIGLIALLL